MSERKCVIEGCARLLSRKEGRMCHRHAKQQQRGSVYSVRRSCQECGAEIPRTRRADAVFCTRACLARRWAREHPDQVKKWARQYADEHREEMREYQRRYYLRTAATKRRPRPGSFSQPFSLDAETVMPHGGTRQRHEAVGDPWSDPVFDAVASAPVGSAEFFALVRRAAVVPSDFYLRCREGDLVLIADDQGVRFLERRRSDIRDVVPWNGSPLVKGFGGTQYKMAPRHRGRRAASMATRGRRSAKTSKAAA